MRSGVNAEYWSVLEDGYGVNAGAENDVLVEDRIVAVARKILGAHGDGGVKSCENGKCRHGDLVWMRQGMARSNKHLA